MQGNGDFHPKSLPKDIPGSTLKKEGPRGTTDDGWWGQRKLKDAQAKPCPWGRLRTLPAVAWYRLAAAGSCRRARPWLSRKIFLLQGFAEKWASASLPSRLLQRKQGC